MTASRAWHSTFFTKLALPLVLAAMPLAQARAAPRFVQCDSPVVQVAASSAQDRAGACAAARDILAFFAAAGMPRTAPLTIEIVTKLPAAAGKTAFGCYVHGQARAYVLSYAVFSRRGLWFRIPIDRRAHRSVVAHEVAHHLTVCNDGWADMSWHGKEYIAYVSMFATMDPVLLERILLAVPGTGFDTVGQITPLSLAFDPEGFAADAYRHYLKPGNGDAFLRSVVEGRALTE
jgi:hypothetical protein